MFTFPFPRRLLLLPLLGDVTLLPLLVLEPVGLLLLLRLLLLLLVDGRGD
jgi:hypothetical protein